MKIYNVSSKKIIGILFLVILLFILFSIALSLMFSSKPIEMTTDNYTDILKKCHDNPYEYINKRFTMSGYIFRNDDFSDTQFVIARDMLVNKNESRIVGFLCEYDGINKFENNIWVAAEGILTIGDYYGAIPIIKINTIHRITTPNDTFVNMPDGFVNTGQNKVF